MKKKLLPLQTQLLRLLFMLVVCTLSIILWSIYDYIKIQEDNLDSYLELYSNQLAQSTRQAYTSYENIAYSVAYNTIVQEYIQQTDGKERYEAYQQVYNLLNNTSKLNPNLADIAIISDNGNSISLTESPSLYTKYEDAVASPSYAFQSMGTITLRKTNCHVLSLPVHLQELTGQSKYLGTVFLAINSHRMFSASLTPDISGTPEIFLVDEYGNLIYGNPALFSGLSDISDGISTEVTINRIHYAARRYSVSESGSQLYVLFNTAQYTQASNAVTLRLSLGISAVMLLMIGSFIVICFPLSHSLRQLTHVMQDITAGEQKTIRKGIDLTNIHFGSSEIRDIYNAFNEMLQEINNLNHTIFNTYTKMYELEMNNRQTEIAFLRSQINPHFLYNTLTTICGMSAAGMNDKIIDVTNALSQIFRYSIQGSDMVSLADELDIIKAYLMIQCCRFEDRFAIQYIIGNDTLSCQIPKMIIQPLVENAIVHGLEPSLKRGKLIIRTALDLKKEHLTISIMDTGVGMPKDKMLSLRSTLQEAAHKKGGNVPEHLRTFDAQNHDSIGIFNVNSRIVLYYGEEYALKLESWEGAGTNIQISIPCHFPVQ